MESRFTEPKTASEGAYQAYYRLAKKASSEWNDLAAIGYWEEMASKIDPKEAEERGWYLLAQKRVADLKKTILERRELVAGLLESRPAGRAIGSTRRGREHPRGPQQELRQIHRPEGAPSHLRCEGAPRCDGSPRLGSRVD